jgi:DNA-binding NtrC family response regulator
MSTVATTRSVELRGGTIQLEAEPSRRLVIGREPILVGRAMSCHLAVNDARVSAMHLELVATPDGVRVRDLGSKNGTWIDSVRVTDAHLTQAVTIMAGPAALLFEPQEPERMKLPASDQFHELYGSSPSMREVFAKIERAAEAEVTVLIEGETGTGKELLAQAVHRASHRRKGPFIVLDCGAISAGLAEATLFGHAKGAFTGAIRDRTSPFVEANGGTLFLDELGELPVDLQPKLLRALAEKRIKPVGASSWIDFDARIVCATRRDLLRAVNDGSFRSDLYFRVAQLRVNVPPLRERVEDIPGLVRVMLGPAGRNAWKRVSRESIERLIRYDWPGNVRELKNVVSVAVALAESGGPIDLAAPLGGATDDSGSPAAEKLGYHAAKRAALDRFERAYFSALIEETGGNIAEISRIAGLQRTHVRRYVKAHALKRKG